MAHIPAAELEVFETLFRADTRNCPKLSFTLPTFELESSTGGRYRAELGGQTPFRLLAFVLGSYSPFCKAQLEAFAAEQRALCAEGIECVFISPQNSAENFELAREIGLQCPLLSDPGGAVAREFGVALELTEPQCRWIASLGIYLGLYHEEDPGVIPVPSLFLTDRRGILIGRWVERRLWRRSGPKTVLEAVADWKARHDST